MRVARHDAPLRLGGGAGVLSRGDRQAGGEVGSEQLATRLRASGAVASEEAPVYYLDGAGNLQEKSEEECILECPEKSEELFGCWVDGLFAP